MKKTTEQFIESAKKIHGDIYNYSFVKYISEKSKVKIICKIHGEFLVSPDNHIRRVSGCPKCGNILRGKKVSLHLTGRTHNNFALSKIQRAENFIKKAVSVHGDKYDYSYAEYISTKKPIIVICKKHGKFKTLPGRHVRGAGCEQCAFEHRRKTLQNFIHEAISVHGNKYNYSKAEYFGRTKKMILICNLHGEFLQSPSHHLRGHGCPVCKESHGEREISQWLNNHSIIYEKQKTFDKCVNPNTKCRLRFDFYIPDKTTCIEFDGEQHFRPSRDKKFTLEHVKQIQFRDGIKNDFCKTHGIKMIRIPYNKTTTINTILEKNLKEGRVFETQTTQLSASQPLSKR